MVKKMETIILICLIIINLIIGSILIVTVSGITAPDIVATVDIIDVNRENITLNIELEFQNPNFFSFIAEDFTVNSTTNNGETIGVLYLKGGEIPANSNKTFSSQSIFSIKGDNFKEINADIKGIVGAKILGIFTKTLPIEIHVITSLKTLFESINPPELSLHTGISDIDNQGINYNGTIHIDNQNPFEIIITNASSAIITTDHDVIGNINVADTIISQYDATAINFNGHISYEALNAEAIKIDFNAQTGASIAGLTKTINISAEASVAIPNINELLLINDTLDFSISSDFKIRLQGIVTTVGLRIRNPSKIPFEARNLQCEIYAVSNNETTFIVEGPMNPCEISSGEEVCIKTTVTMPYLKILQSGISKLLPDWFVLSIKGEFAIANTTQAIPISLSGYLDPNIFN